MGAVLVAIYILFKFLDLSHTSYVWTHFGICTVGVVVANSVVTVFLHQKNRGWAYALALFFGLGLIVATDYFDHVPNKILGNYGFGQTNAQLVVNDDGYKTLRAAGFKETDFQTSGPIVASNVTILCRMGPNLFLQFENMDKKLTKMTLRKSDLISWTVREK